MTIFLFVMAYLLGSIPFGFLLMKKFAKVDVRTLGSGNIGATNVLRSGNKGIAALTLFLDGFKGTLAVLMAYILTEDESLYYLVGCIAVIGHVFPVWLKFKGGKGVATVLGTLLALHPLVFVGVSLTWYTVAKLFRISSAAALTAFALAPFMALALHRFDLAKYLGATFLLLCFTHRENIKRLLNGKEGKF